MKLEIHKRNVAEFNWTFSERGVVIAAGKTEQTHEGCKRKLIALIRKIQADDFTVYDESVDVRPGRVNKHRVRGLSAKR